MKENKTNLSKCLAISLFFMNSFNPHLYGSQSSDEDQKDFESYRSHVRNFDESRETIKISRSPVSRKGNTSSPQTKKFAERDIEISPPPLASGSSMKNENVRQDRSPKQKEYDPEKNQKKKSHKKPRTELSKSPSSQPRNFTKRDKDIEGLPPVLLSDEPIDKGVYHLSETEDLDNTPDKTKNTTIKNDKEITNNVKKRHSHSEESQERNAYDENNDHYKIQDIKTQIKIDYINGVLCDEKIKVLQGSKYLHLYSIHPPQGIKDSRYFKNSALIVSPDTINPEVEIIKFQLCRLRDDYIKDINKLKKIKHLEIILCGITDLGVEYITQLSDLERLNLNSNKITDVGVKSISKLTKLKSLNLSINNNITYESVSLLKEIKSLEELNIEHTNISPSEYHEISGWRNWKILEYFPLNIKHM